MGGINPARIRKLAAVALNLNIRDDGLMLTKRDHMPYFLLCSDLATALVGPFKTIEEAAKHREFCEERGDADPGVIIHEDELHNYSPDYTITAEEDRAQ